MDDEDERGMIVERATDVALGRGNPTPFKDFIEELIAEGVWTREEYEAERAKVREMIATGNVKLDVVELCQLCARELPDGEHDVCGDCRGKVT